MVGSKLFTLGLAILLYVITVSDGADESASFRSRSRRLVSRYRSRLGPKSIVNGRRMYWYCRRGTKLAICHRNNNRAKTIRRASSEATTRGGCHHAKCVNGKCISSKCDCKSGWTGRRCTIDINECTRALHSCNHFCVNVAGSYRCICRPGYTLQADGRSCQVVLMQPYHANSQTARHNNPNLVRRGRPFTKDVITSGRKPAKKSPAYKAHLRYPALSRWYLTSRLRQKTCRKGCRYRCFVDKGMEKCLCPRGFSLGADARSCIDLNECLDSAKTTCPVNQECRNTYGGFTCKCRVGYILSHGLAGKTCRDVDECLSGEHKCGRKTACVNTIGSYACNCLQGYVKHGDVCSRIDSLLGNTDPNEAPAAQQPSFLLQLGPNGKQLPVRRPELE